MIDRKVPDRTRKNILGQYETLCWSCDKAISACSWSRFFVPVDGWDAKKTKHGSYRVYDCPKFAKG